MSYSIGLQSQMSFQSIFEWRIFINIKIYGEYGHCQAVFRQKIERKRNESVTNCVHFFENVENTSDTNVECGVGFGVTAGPFCVWQKTNRCFNNMITRNTLLIYMRANGQSVGSALQL